MKLFTENRFGPPKVRPYPSQIESKLDFFRLHCNLAKTSKEKLRKSEHLNTFIQPMDSLLNLKLSTRNSKRLFSQKQAAKKSTKRSLAFSI